MNVIVNEWLLIVGGGLLATLLIVVLAVVTAVVTELGVLNKAKNKKFEDPAKRK